MNNNATLYAGMTLILNMLHNITNNPNTTLPATKKAQGLQDIAFLKDYIHNKAENKTKETDNNRITLLKCEEDLYESSEKLGFMMDSLSKNDKEGCILKQLVKNKNIAAANETLNHGANVNGYCGGSSILHAAVATNDDTLIQIVLDKGADVNKEDRNELIPVQLAATKGYDKAVTKLAAISTPKWHGKSKDKLPHLAAKAGHVSVLRALHNLFPTEMVKEMNKLRETPLLVAAANGHLEALEAVIVMGADLNHKDKNGHTALHKAIGGKHIDIVDYLLGLKHFDVNAPNDKGNTLFHFALLSGQEDVVNKVIYGDARANVRLEGADGQTVLHFAAYSNMERYLKLFLSAGIDINKGTIYNETPLHVAVRQNSKEAAIALINEDGIDLNAKNNKGETPLHVAAISNAKEIAEELLKNDADHLEENYVNQTPFDLAEDIKNFEIAFILKKASDP